MIKDEKTTRKQRTVSARRPLVEAMLAFCGAVAVIVSRLLFDSRFSSPLSESASVARDNFMLFYKLSLALCAVLLLLTALSVVCSVLHRESPRVFRITARLSPLLCSLIMLVLALFYAYLTAGGANSITPHLLALGIGEALLLRLPCVIYTLFEYRSGSKVTTKGTEK